MFRSAHDTREKVPIRKCDVDRNILKNNLAFNLFQVPPEKEYNRLNVIQINIVMQINVSGSIFYMGKGNPLKDHMLKWSSIYENWIINNLWKLPTAW